MGPSRRDFILPARPQRNVSFIHLRAAALVYYKLRTHPQVVPFQIEAWTAERPWEKGVFFREAEYPDPIGDRRPVA
jgi:hypothetical protein